MDETKEGIEKQKEIDELISGQLTEEDELAVEAELEEILDIDDKLPDVPADKLPDTSEVVTNERHRIKEKSAKVAIEA